jgi:predicted phage baseplate assembly protein
MVPRGKNRELIAFDPTASATAAFRWSTQHITPSIFLTEVPPNKKAPVLWWPKRDLLESRPGDPHFVAEIEHDGTATLRLGDDVYGKRPSTDSTFSALYRIGNGTDGNIGAGSLAHVVTDVLSIAAVENPLPARGGVDPESAEHIRQHAPYAFRIQERAVTAEDYARVTERLPGVQRAVATFRWTGSWYTAFVAVDRLGGRRVDDAFRQTVREHLERYRLAGRDVEVVEPVLVPLDIALHVCAKSEFFQSQVKQGILDLFHAQARPDGQAGIFHPDHFSFGQPVFLSRLYKAAQEVPGVESVHFTTFQRLGFPSLDGLDRWQLDMGEEEIACLDNDPNFPERGVFHVTVDGGR